jgi:hypothetical protein
VIGIGLRCAAAEVVKPLLENWDEIVLSPKPDMEGVVAQY